MKSIERWDDISTKDKILNNDLNIKNTCIFMKMMKKVFQSHIKILKQSVEVGSCVHDIVEHVLQDVSTAAAADAAYKARNRVGLSSDGRVS